MATGSASTHIDATPEAVYDLVAEVTRMGEWSPETYRVEWKVGSSAAPGNRFRGWNRMGVARWFTDPVIDVADRGRELTFTTTLFGRGRFTTWSFHLAPAEGGGTTLTESWQSHARPLERVFAGGRSDALQRGMEQTLERIKAAAEAG